MNIYFRADANSIIGSGHVMRCLSIAEAVQRAGACCRFVCADQLAQTLVESRGFKAYCMHSDYTHMEAELEQLLPMLKTEKPDWLVVDSYFVTEKYFQAIRPYGKTAYIDDLGERGYPVHALIDYNIFGEELPYSDMYPADTKLLLGARYAPLRVEFDGIAATSGGRCGNLMLTTGGADPLHVAIRLLERFQRDRTLQRLTVHVVVGALNQDAGTIAAMAQKDSRIRVHRDVTHMAELMCSCDLAISAGGSTLYELCACGVPTVCYTFADNQLLLAEGFAKREIMLYAGDFRMDADGVSNRICNAVERLVADAEERRSLSERMTAVVDGKGAHRIARFFMEHSQKSI